MNDLKTTNPAIIVMVKAPRAGTVKTRLQPFLNPEQAAKLARCFLLDTIANAQKCPAKLIIAFAPDDGREMLEKLIEVENVVWIQQIGEDLGAKLESVTTAAENLSFAPLIIIGADSPTTPPEFLKQAISALGEHEIVLAPTTDGGFYLLGLNASAPGLFENVAWSTETVFEQMRRNAANIGLARLFQLPKWFDIDTEIDLKNLRRDFLMKPELQSRAPETFAWIKENELLF